MKKLIFSLIAGVALIAGTSVQTQACNGTASVCKSQKDKVAEDIAANCGKEGTLTIIWLDC